MKEDQGVAAADPHADGAVDDVYARPEAPDAADYDYPYDDDMDDDDDWSELMCSMGPDGQCGQAGSEYCDFDCPYREGHP